MAKRFDFVCHNCGCKSINKGVYLKDSHIRANGHRLCRACECESVRQEKEDWQTWEESVADGII